MSNRLKERSRTNLIRPETVGPAWLGKRVGRFRLVSELGRGAMGRVFRAEDTLLHRQVALKVLPKFVRRGNRTVAAERLISEARAAATLDHPSIVNIYEVNESGGMYYIAMELLEGGSLRDIVKAAGPMDCARACFMCADAADGLAQAHSLGIVHRDVKPANLMLTRSGRCKVVDFGLARMDDAGDLSSSLPESVGTPQFIAPELLRGVPASARSDAYSLGATLWFLLTGHPPFEAATAADLLRQHLEAPLPDLSALRPDLPPGLVQVVSKAMAKRPADRFESAAQLEKVLRVYTISPEPSTSGSLGSLVAVTEPIVPETSFTPAPFTLRLRLPRRPAVMLGAAGAGLLLFLVLLVPALRALRPSHNTLPDAAAPVDALSAAAVRPVALTPRPNTYGQRQLGPLIEDAQMFASRGKTYARHGQFMQAAADYAKAVQLDPTDPFNWFYHGCLVAYIGDIDGYQNVCKGMFQRFASSSDATVRDKTAKTCCLLEESGVAPKELLAIAEGLPPDGNNSPDLAAWFSLCKGMALYRTGQYSKCIEQMQGAKTPNRLGRVSAAILFQAMAQWQQGKHADAQTTLRQATDRMNEALARSGIDDLGRDDGLENWLACQAVRRQAEKLISH